MPCLNGVHAIVGVSSKSYVRNHGDGHGQRHDSFGLSPFGVAVSPYVADNNR
jgi:hypothetical protein